MPTHPSEGLPIPTDAELSVLRLLWAKGPSTVRQLHEALSQERDLGYTTVLKAVQVMLEKGLVNRDDSERSHVYRAAVAEGQTKGQLVFDLMAKAFAGSASELLVHALKAGQTNPAELDAIQRLLDEARRGRS
ncbi:transcriptional regulator [Geothrix oryzae]|jgi:predicted transcriptional regulator|uniref:Transcriptional regulator n=1 Tax=Geothrix oryzae TaxID=2927975 RepID=A0ABN6V2Q4_9BACT|nr:BlaI/MecI/CopY family transcriptional regulator [Geothrix oryzae]BDU70395.1 transcriptional regulator [Geothrix oryzae]